MRTGSLLAAIAILLPHAVGAQEAVQAGKGDVSGALRRGFNEVGGYVTRAAEMVPADKYSYRPTASVRTFGQLIGHIADSHNYFCAQATGRNVQWSDPVEKGGGDKAALMQKLKESIDGCRLAYGTNGQTGALLSNIGHTNLHYGNIVTYLRMMGMVPPSS